MWFSPLWFLFTPPLALSWVTLLRSFLSPWTYPNIWNTFLFPHDPTCHRSLAFHLLIFSITPSSSDTYPRSARSLKQADTPGCTNQACGFRDHLSEIKELGYDIYGLSKDKPAALKRVCPLPLPPNLSHSYMNLHCTSSKTTDQATFALPIDELSWWTVENKEGIELYPPLRPRIEIDKTVCPPLPFYPSLLCLAPFARFQIENKLTNQIRRFHSPKQVRIVPISLYLRKPLYIIYIFPCPTRKSIRPVLTPSSCRSHFIFDKEKGQLVDIAIKVKPADEYVQPLYTLLYLPLLILTGDHLRFYPLGSPSPFCLSIHSLICMECLLMVSPKNCLAFINNLHA